MQYNLPQLGLLRIEGEKAKAFLQGQLTCDLEKITATTSSLAAHCNPQGRVISLFHLCMRASAYYLLMPREMVSLTLAALKKYAVFFKVTLEDVSAQWTIIGEDTPTQPDSIPLSLLSQRSYLLIPSAPTQTQNDTSAWITKNIEEKIPTIYPATSAKFLPQELYLDEHGAISYDKGCYTGQEIIARLHYRGKAKSHLYQAMIRSTSTLNVGDDIHVDKTNARECGTIIESLADSPICLVVMTDADSTKHDLFAHDAEDNITIQTEV